MLHKNYIILLQYNLQVIRLIFLKIKLILF